MKKYNLNMYQVPILKIYRIKQHWYDWLKYRLQIPKKITTKIIANLIGGYKGNFNLKFPPYFLMKQKQNQKKKLEKY